MVSVSVAIITKNEEQNIEDALRSVDGFEDIVVVDNFSNDRTVEICRKYTERVYQHPWHGYARQKQIAIDYANKEWVLILDADERITLDLRREIMENISTTDCNGFYIPRKNFFLGKWIRHSGWWPDYTLRLFRKARAYMEPREVHEKVVVSGKVGHLENPMEHYTYRTISDFLERMDKYSTLAAREIIKKGVSMPALKMFLNPGVTFLKMFFIRQGFRDGAYGLIISILYSYYTFVKYAKVWEAKDKIQNVQDL